MSDPFADIIREQAALDKTIERARLKETPLYSTGVWTPAFVGTTTPGTFTYAVQGAEYTRIGNRCFLNGRMSISAITVAPVGVISVTGLPFAAVSGAQAIAGGIHCHLWVMNITAGYTCIGGQIANATSVITLVKSGDGMAGASVIAADFVMVGANLEIRFEGQYRIE